MELECESNRLASGDSAESFEDDPVNRTSTSILHEETLSDWRIPIMQYIENGAAPRTSGKLGNLKQKSPSTIASRINYINGSHPAHILLASSTTKPSR